MPSNLGCPLGNVLVARYPSAIVPKKIINAMLIFAVNCQTGPGHHGDDEYEYEIHHFEKFHDESRSLLPKPSMLWCTDGTNHR